MAPKAAAAKEADKARQKAKAKVLPVASTVPQQDSSATAVGCCEV